MGSDPAESARQSGIDKLPPEIILECMKLLPDVLSLNSFQLASKRLNECFRCASRSVCKAVITNQIGTDLLPIAIACFIAARGSSGLPSALAAYRESRLNASTLVPEDASITKEYDSRVIKFCRTYLRDHATRLGDPLPEFTLRTVLQLSIFHSWLSYPADHFIHECMEFLRKSHDYPITPVERARFYKALYIRRLVALVIPLEDVRRQPHRKLFHKFWRCFAPWEKRQVCILSEEPFEGIQNISRQIISDMLRCGPPN